MAPLPIRFSRLNSCCHFSMLSWIQVPLNARQTFCSINNIYYLLDDNCSKMDWAEDLKLTLKKVHIAIAMIDSIDSIMNNLSCSINCFVGGKWNIIVCICIHNCDGFNICFRPWRRVEEPWPIRRVPRINQAVEQRPPRIKRNCHSIGTFWTMIPVHLTSKQPYHCREKSTAGVMRLYGRESECFYWLYLLM